MPPPSIPASAPLSIRQQLVVTPSRICAIPTASAISPCPKPASRGKRLFIAAILHLQKATDDRYSAGAPLILVPRLILAEEGCARLSIGLFGRWGERRWDARLAVGGSHFGARDTTPQGCMLRGPGIGCCLVDASRRPHGTHGG